MAKNNFVIEKAKEIARLKKKIELDTAYIGAGLILALKDNGFDDDMISSIMQSTNEIWTRLASEGINPLKYCYEQTGFEVSTGDEADRINSYFEE